MDAIALERPAARLISRRAAGHYLAAAVIMPIYGIQVCPFVASLSPRQVVLPITALLFVLYVLRRPLCAAWVETAPPLLRIKRTFILEFGLFVCAAAALTLFNTLVYGFPLVSGLKLTVGLLALGFFCAVDLSLEKERDLAQKVMREGLKLDPGENYFPLSKKFSFFASASALLVIGVVFLLINKDLDWIVDVGNEIPLAEAQKIILAEFAFVLAVLLPHLVNIILSYSRNLKVFFENENGVLEGVTKGRLDGAVPVSSNDEFGVMAKHTNWMVRGLRERTEEVHRTRDVTILTLASLAETRDNETGAHILRTQRYVKALAVRLTGHPRFADALDPETVDLLYKSAPLHDIGKVGIPDRILLKPGKLTEEEFEIMKTHAQLGSDALAVAEKELGTTSFLRIAREISLAHHEKWDGSGYPGGLKGSDIPVSGRLMAVADVYDALISKRVYKPAFSHEKACGIIKEGIGAHFDPDVVEAFFEAEDDFKAIAEKYNDGRYS